ncbi:MAG: hypothetical protein HY060_21695 [Proteobacteria bacterium]|nr:hypothetical protein [Pseudomonadota bacterium]
MATPLDRDKLLKLLALLGSDQEGEVLAAARRIDAMLREADRGWDEIVTVPSGRSWLQVFEFSTLYFLELKRRISAERSAENWQAIARAREDELRRLKTAPEPARVEAAARRRVERITGHELIDRLLSAQELDPTRRARVEAIATWFKKTQTLTRAEETDLETMLRQLETAG